MNSPNFSGRSGNPNAAFRPEEEGLIPLCRNGLDKAPRLILYILLSLASAMLPIGAAGLFTTSRAMLTTVNVISVVILILLTAYTFRAGRSARGLMPLLIIIEVGLILTTRSPIPSAILCALLFIIGIGAMPVAVEPRSMLKWMPLLPILGYGLSLIVTRNWMLSLLAFAPVPATVTMALATRSSAGKKGGLTRVGVICAVSLALGLTVVAAELIQVYAVQGSLSLTAIRDFFENAREEMIQTITGLELPAIGEDGTPTVEKISRETAENAVNSVINLLPAYVVLACNLLAAVSQMFLHAALTAFNYGSALTARVKLFRISAVSGVVFIIAYMMTIALNGTSSTLVGTVAENIYMVLMPGLALSGLMRLMFMLTHRGAPRMGCMFFLLLIVPCLLIIAPMLLAIYDAISSLIDIFAARRRKNSDGFGGDSGSTGGNSGGDSSDPF